MGLEARVIERGTVRVSLWGGHGETVAFSGVVREPDVSTWLLPLIDEVHRAATGHRLPEIVLDIRRLEYANAALWKCLVLWLRRLRDESPTTYTLRIVSDTSRHWQQVGIPKLRVFGGANLSIDEAAA